MSSLQRTIEGDALVHHLKRDTQTIDQDLLGRHGRSARTLVKEGPLRLTLIALAAGGALPSHHTEGPVSVHLLEGDVVFDAAEREYPLVPGEVLVLAAGVPHAARSTGGCVLLLTVVHLPSPGSPLPPT
jgi:quercetin dioxygenase-like cupin family protein